MEIKDPISLKVQFIFNSSAPWTRLADFEKDMAKFLADHSMKADVIRHISEQWGELIFFVKERTMVEEALPDVHVQKPAPTQIKTMLKKI